MARARNVAGVQGVIDRLQVADRTIRPAQYQPQVALGHGHGGYTAGTTFSGGVALALSTGSACPVSVQVLADS